MSLARNPQAAYTAAGQQQSPYQRISVRSNVYLPGGEARADYNGRPSYQAPDNVRRAPLRISMKAVVALVSAAVFVLSMFYVSALSRRAGVYKEAQALYNEIQSLERGIVETKEKIALACDPYQLQMEAVRLGMINAKGKEPIYLSAPDTRPLQAEHSLTAGSARAFAEP